MHDTSELPARLPTGARYAIAVGLFLAALAVQALILPHPSGLAFVAYFSAVALAFYLCGVAPGWVTAVLSVLSQWLDLSPASPGSPWGMVTEPDAERLAGAAAFVVATSILSIIVRSMRQTSARLLKANRALRQLTLEQQALLDNDLIGILILRGREVSWVNRAICRMFGYKDSELIGQSTRILHPDGVSYEVLEKAARAALRPGAHYRTQWEVMKKDGKTFWVDISGAMVEGKDEECVWMMLDISEMKKQQASLEHLASFDILTGLLRRRVLLEELGQAMARARRRGSLLAVLYVDLDAFKPVNDTHGHQAGDEVLKEVGRRMKEVVRGTDLVARAGGDEFVIVLEDLPDLSAVTRIAGEVVRSIGRPIALGEASVIVGASVGISVFPDDAEEIDRLIEYADKAMYKSKTAGGKRFTLYSAIAPGRSVAPWIALDSLQEVGIDEVDRQHKKLIRLANALNDAVKTEQPTPMVLRLFDELVQFIQLHFATEEHLMAKFGYPDIEAHRRLHGKLLEDVELIRKRLSEGSELVALQTIKDWLVYHVRTADRPMGEFLARSVPAGSPSS